MLVECPDGCYIKALAFQFHQLGINLNTVWIILKQKRQFPAHQISWVSDYVSE